MIAEAECNHSLIADVAAPLALQLGVTPSMIKLLSRSVLVCSWEYQPAYHCDANKRDDDLVLVVVTASEHVLPQYGEKRCCTSSWCPESTSCGIPLIVTRKRTAAFLRWRPLLSASIRPEKATCREAKVLLDTCASVRNDADYM
ncbi:hypothetical protein GN244_ATG14888 [Phytophthora infestans]|uniref:Uncharacterized protein n=1 Tax=Phytophthora infestans TaxID=4787 RepID=A0A833T3I3_PHYIN|nr:hypothetical protein GN244_ATG14888 [Phytophthora infestans]KAF4142892.1 hypothetical protein GN958_ATG07878 [Phytophthora infestans]